MDPKSLHPIEEGSEDHADTCKSLIRACPDQWLPVIRIIVHWIRFYRFTETLAAHKETSRSRTVASLDLGLYSSQTTDD